MVNRTPTISRRVSRRDRGSSPRPSTTQNALVANFLNGYQSILNNAELIASALAILVHWLMQELSHPQTFGLLFERVEQRQQEENNWSEKWVLTDVRQAIQDLRSCFKRVRSQELAIECQPNF